MANCDVVVSLRKTRAWLMGTPSEFHWKIGLARKTLRIKAERMMGRMRLVQTRRCSSRVGAEHILCTEPYMPVRRSAQYARRRAWPELREKVVNERRCCEVSETH